MVFVIEYIRKDIEKGYWRKLLNSLGGNQLPSDLYRRLYRFVNYRGSLAEGQELKRGLLAWCSEQDGLCECGAGLLKRDSGTTFCPACESEVALYEAV